MTILGVMSKPEADPAIHHKIAHHVRLQLDLLFIKITFHSSPRVELDYDFIVLFYSLVGRVVITICMM